MSRRAGSRSCAAGPVILRHCSGLRGSQKTGFGRRSSLAHWGGSFGSALIGLLNDDFRPKADIGWERYLIQHLDDGYMQAPYLAAKEEGAVPNDQGRMVRPICCPKKRGCGLSRRDGVRVYVPEPIH